MLPSAVMRLLPTPEEKLHRSGVDTARAKRPMSGGDDLITAVYRLTLLPTPTVTQYGSNRGGAAGNDTGEYRESLAAMATRGRFLPTPTEADSRNSRNSTCGRTDQDFTYRDGTTLSDVGFADKWKDYAAAIERWEYLMQRPPAEPTIISKRTGNPTLNPRFVEWMMGLPDGWVEDVPKLSKRSDGHRGAALSLLGDGVVPQQGVAAFTVLFDALEDI